MDFLQIYLTLGLVIVGLMMLLLAQRRHACHSTLRAAANRRDLVDIVQLQQSDMQA